jgi:hypothetical protein
MLILGMQVSPGELTFRFEERTDLRSVDGEPVLVTRQLTIPTDHPTYRADIETLLAGAESLVEEVIADYATAETFVPGAPDEEDDDEQFGDR